MKNNLLTDHPSVDVKGAALQLLDALCSWERSTGRHNVVIIKDSIGVDYRTFDGAPVNEYTSDAVLLEMYDNISREDSPQQPTAGSANEKD